MSNKASKSTDYYLKKVQELSETGTWELDIQKNILFWTEENYKIFGIPFDTKMNFKLFLECIHPEDREFVAKKWDAALQKEPYDIEHRLLVDGKIKWVREKADIEFDENDKPIKAIGITQDITRLKKNELKLIFSHNKIKESEEKYKTLYHNAPLSFQSLDINGNILDVNPAWLSILGYSREEITGKWFGDYLHPDYVDSFKINFSKFKKKGRVHNVLFKLRHKNGSYLQISLEGCIGYNSDGSFRQTNCTFIDITSQKKAEQALENISKQFSAISGKEFFENVCRHLTKTLDVDIAFIGKLTDNRKEINVISGIENGKKINSFKYELENTPCKNVLEDKVCFYPSKIQSLFPKDYLLIDMKIEGYTGIPIHNRNGSTIGIVVLLNRTPLKDKEIYTNILKVFSDRISSEVERMQFETDLINTKKEVEKSEERFRLAMNAANDGLYDWNLITNEIYFSPRWKSMLGYKEEELANDLSTWKKLASPNDIERSWILQQELIDKKVDRIEMEIKMQHKDGHWLDILSRAHLMFDENGKATRMVGTHVDITKRKLAEKELIESKEIAAQNELKFKVLYDSSPDMHMSVSSETSEIILCNKTFLAKTGFSKNEIIGAPFLTIYHKNSIEEAKKYSEDFKISGSINNKELIIKTKKGNKINVSLNVTLIKDENGKALYSLSSLRDISERVMLREQQIRDRQLLNITGSIAKVGGWSLELRTQKLLWTKEVYKIHELDDSFIPTVEKALDFYEINSKKIIEEALIKTIEKGESFNVDLKIITAKGNHKNVRSLGQIQLNDKGIPDIVYGSFQDITELKLLEAEKNKLSSAVEQSANAVVITDLKGVIEYVNPAFTEISGYPAEEVLGENPRILNSGTHSKEYYNSMWKSISKGEIWRGEFLNIAKNGKQFWEDATVSSIKNEDGEIINYLAIKKDITKQKEDEKKLKEKNKELVKLSNELSEKNRLLFESKSKFQMLFDKSPVSIMEQDFSEAIKLIDKKKTEFSDIEVYLNENPAFVEKCVSEIKLVNVNEQTLSMIGVKNMDELVSHLRKTNTKKTFNSLKNEFISIALGHKDFYGETELTKSDGTTLLAIIKSTMIDGKGRNIASIVDITAITKAQEEIKSLNTAIGKSVNEVYIFGAESLKFYYANNKALESTGFTLEELKMMTPVDIKPEYSFENFNEIIAPLRKEKIGNLQFETIHQRKDKTTYPVEINISKFKVNNKSRFLALIIDITHRKIEKKKLNEAKEKAEGSKNYLDNIINGMGDPVFVKDDQSRLLLVNDAFCNLFNLTRADIIGKTLVDEVSQEEQEAFLRVDNQVLLDGKESIEDETLTIRDNKKLTISTRKTRFIDEKGNKFIIGVIRDISDLKQVEHKLLKAKEKAEESDNLKTEFLNNMSHEIRTPMNGILGFSEMLSNDDLTDKRRQSYVKIIQNSGNQLLQVINDILEISELGTKQVKVINEVVCLNELLLELFSVFDIKAKENKTPLYLKKQLSDKESTVLTDKNKLYKVLINLLENAIKFTNVGQVEFGYLLKNNEIEIFVKDSGIGINQNKHKSIFERFSQVEKDLSKKTGGLGLGLSIAKENTELLGGTILLESEEGKGSTFFITIPYVPVFKRDSINVIKTSEQHQYTILIVEDEEVNYLLLETLMKDIMEIDCNLIHAKNGEEAVDVCKEMKNIDLVLMDLKMPLMNGFEAAKLIKEFKPNLPIIAQTAYSTIEDKGKAIDAGCDDFISKPIIKDSLNKLINKYLVLEDDNN